MPRFSELPKDRRPRERLARSGPEALSDQELLAILLGSGTPQADVLSVAQTLLNVLDASNGRLSLAELRAVDGIGGAKASQVLAALEFSRRRFRPREVKIRRAEDVAQLCSHLCDRTQEHFVCITLNGAHEVIASRVITIGLVDRTQVHPREVYAEAVSDRATAIIVAHNHPSGQPAPSQEDERMTAELSAAGRLLGIELLDHVIFTRSGYYSFKESGNLG